MDYEKQFMNVQELLDKRSDGITALRLWGEECVYQDKHGYQIPDFVYAGILEDGEITDQIFWRKGFSENYHPRHEFLIQGDKIILGFRRQGQAFFYGFGRNGSEGRGLVLFMKLKELSHLIYADASGSIILDNIN